MKIIRIVDFVGHGVVEGKDASPLYLESFDFEAHGGQGFALFTNDKAKAKRFADTESAFEFWRTTSKTVPTRPDGKPNRPLTAATIEIEEA